MQFREEECQRQPKALQAAVGLAECPGCNRAVWAEQQEHKQSREKLPDATAAPGGDCESARVFMYA